jgi:hypothetical protein
MNEGETVESLNMNNLEGPLSVARRNIIENIATAADMPAKILLQETFAEGFGEGVEDANYVADYLDQMREWMKPAYTFFDKVTMYRAWNEEFYASLCEKYGKKEIGEDYQEAFYRWRDSFVASWPSLKREPESVRVQVEETKLQAILAVMQTLLPMADPDNKAKILEWMQANMNSSSNLFSNDLDLDFDALVEYAEEMQEKQMEMAASAGGGEEGGPPKESRNDSTVLASYMGRKSLNPAETRIAKIEDFLAKRKAAR